jgi:hypothetical protein
MLDAQVQLVPDSIEKRIHESMTLLDYNLDDIVVGCFFDSKKKIDLSDSLN